MSKTFCYYCKNANKKKRDQRASKLYVQCTSDAANEGQKTDMVSIDDACDFYESMNFNEVIESEE